MLQLVRRPVFILKDINRQLIRNMSSANDNTVLFEEVNNKGIITLNRPKALNAINLDMVRLIYSRLKPWESTKELVIIKGAGDKAFCAGGDVRAVVEGGTSDSSKNFFKEEYTMNALIGSYKIPYVAIIDGITMGGGVGLSVHGKYRVATERTMFAMPETAIGLFPDVGGGYFLPRLEGKLGLYLGLTGHRLKGKDVMKCGVATHYIESTNLPNLESALLNTKSPQEVDQVLKEMCPIHKSEFILAKNLKQINKVFASKTIEGIMTNLKKDGSDWANSTIKLLNKMSPTSLKVTQRQLEIGSKLTLNECLQMEYRMAVHSLEKSDFAEGVRALLIDKDQSPKWRPKVIEDVTEDHIKFFFSKFPSSSEELILDGGKAKL